MNPIIANLWLNTKASVSPPARMYLTFFILQCLLQWIWKSFVKWRSEIAYSISAQLDWRISPKRKHQFCYQSCPGLIPERKNIFFPPGELDLRLSCVYLVPFKVSILNKRTVFPPPICFNLLWQQGLHFRRGTFSVSLHNPTGVHSCATGSAHT